MTKLLCRCLYKEKVIYFNLCVNIYGKFFFHNIMYLISILLYVKYKLKMLLMIVAASLLSTQSTKSLLNKTQS